MDVIRLIFKGCLLCVATVGPLAAQTDSANQGRSSVLPSQATTVKREYVGNVGCRNCHKHDKIWDSFYKNPHFKSVASGKEPPERTGCEGCHGPGKAHVDAGGDINTVVYAFSVMKPQEIIALCLNCHAQEFNRANIRRSEHTEHDIACTACHSIHGAATTEHLLSKSQPDLCYGCHV